MRTAWWGGIIVYTCTSHDSRLISHIVGFQASLLIAAGTRTIIFLDLLKKEIYLTISPDIIVLDPGKCFLSKSHYLSYLILYYFDQFGSHASRTLVFCRKLVVVTGHGAECRIDPSCDMTKMPQNWPILPVFGLFHAFSLSRPSAAPILVPSTAK
jgi:hypothetical protein